MSLVRKVVADEGDGLEFVLSDNTVDRYGDVIEADGWDLKWFKKNPIALFGHAAGFPIGKWADIRVEGGKLLARLVFAAQGTSARIDELRSLVEQGILRAVSVGFRALEATEMKGGGYRYTKQELLETSLVSVPANPAALAVAKSLHISDETISLAFGEQAEVRRRDVPTGENAAPPTNATPQSKGRSMSTLSQRIENAQNELNIKRDKLVELTSDGELDVTAIDELTAEIDAAEKSLSSLKAAEEKIGLGAVSNYGATKAPAQVRRPLGFGQQEVKGLDLLIRRAVVYACAKYGEKSFDDVLEERYPGHEATAMIVKADQTVGTTTVSGWASELMQTSYQGFIDALRGRSIYPELRDRGMGINFDKAGTAYIPGLTAGGANGSFFGEGSPIRVGRITTNSTTMGVKKMGVIIPFTREAAKRSTPSLEQMVRRAILDDTAATLDSIMLDATASSAIRPAGLLNGISATATGYGGGDYEAVVADFKALLAPFITANAADNITVIMNPAQGLAIDMMKGPDGTGGLGEWFGKLRGRVNIIESTNATAGRLVALRATDFATALGDAPEFEMSNQATVHMEDSAPLEIVSGTGPTTADPVRSFWQTDTMGVRMVMEVNWQMLRSGMVKWIDTTSY